jgi:hypothetical protein
MLYARAARAWGDRHLRRFPADLRGERNNFRHARRPRLRRILAKDVSMIASRWMLLALAALSGCAAPPPGTMAPQTAASQVAAPAAAPAETTLDRTVTLPSGATLKVAADWTVTAATDGLILEDPEKQLKIELVEVEAAAGMSAAISTAWSRRRPGFNRQELAASDSPGREGWDLFRWSRYCTRTTRHRTPGTCHCGTCPSTWS